MASVRFKYEEVLRVIVGLSLSPPSIGVLALSVRCAPLVLRLFAQTKAPPRALTACYALQGCTALLRLGNASACLRLAGTSVHLLAGASTRARASGRGNARPPEGAELKPVAACLCTNGLLFLIPSLAALVLPFPPALAAVHSRPTGASGGETTLSRSLARPSHVALCSKNTRVVGPGYA